MGTKFKESFQIDHLIKRTERVASEIRNEYTALAMSIVHVEVQEVIRREHVNGHLAQMRVRPNNKSGSSTARTSPGCVSLWCDKCGHAANQSK